MGKRPLRKTPAKPQRDSAAPSEDPVISNNNAPSGRSFRRLEPFLAILCGLFLFLATKGDRAWNSAIETGSLRSGRKLESENIKNAKGIAGSSHLESVVDKKPESESVKKDKGKEDSSSPTHFEAIVEEMKQAVEDHCYQMSTNSTVLEEIKRRAYISPVQPWLSDQKFHFDLVIHKTDGQEPQPGVPLKPVGHIKQIATQLAESISEYKRQSPLKERPTVLDIGVNYGWATFISASMDANVLSFEAMQSNVEFLRTALCLSPPEIRERITLFDFGLSHKKQECLIASLGNANIGNGKVFCLEDGQSMETYQPPNGMVVREKVKLRSLDEVLSLDGTNTSGTHSLTDVDVVAVKMDTEGHEPFVVEGAKNFFRTQKVPAIHSEFQLREMTMVGANPSAMMKFFFDELGYEVLENRPHHWRRMGRKPLKREVAMNMASFKGLHDLLFRLPAKSASSVAAS